MQIKAKANKMSEMDSKRDCSISNITDWCLSSTILQVSLEILHFIESDKSK